MLQEIEQRINLSTKNICFVALKLNHKVIDHLQVLNKTFVMDVMENLKILNQIDNHFKIVEIFYRLKDESLEENIKNEEESLDLNRKQDVMKYLLKELRREIYYYPPIHRDKKLDNNVIILAGGKADINYYIGLDRKNKLYVEIRFGDNYKKLFEIFLEKQEEICDKLDYLTEFDVQNRKIGTYLYFRNDKRNMLIYQIVRVTDKYIKYFSKYLFLNNHPCQVRHNQK